MLDPPEPELNSRAPAFATALVIGVAFVFSMAVNWPGHLSYDSVIQLLEGRTGQYSGWHPPVMSWLLGLGDTVKPGADLFMVGTATLFFAAVACIPWLTNRPSWLAVPVALLCAGLPQLVLYQAIVWKDVLFANAAIAGFVLVAQASVHWASRGRRYVLLVASALFFILMALARQNGIVVVPFAALAVGWAAKGVGAPKRAAAFVCAFGLCVLAGWLGGRALLNLRVTGDRGEAKQLRLLEFYDLNGALAANRALSFPDLQRRDPRLLALMRSDGRTFYSPARSDFLARSAPLQAALANAPDDILHRSWKEYALHHPLIYLRNRTDVFRWVLLTPVMKICVPYAVGLRGPAAILSALGVRERVNGRDRGMERYAASFVGTPVYAHLTFLLLAVAELLFLLWRRRSIDGVFCCLLLGSIAFACSFFFVSIACDYRYLYLLDVAAIASVIYIASTSRLSASRLRREADATGEVSLL